MAMSVKIVGGDALMAALKALPEQLAEEAGGIVAGHAGLAAAKVVAAYPVHTGNLKKGVTVTRESFGLTVMSKVKSTAPHAYIFENGTNAPRRTEKGWNRGKMPPGNVFLPITLREKAALRQDMIALVERAGFKVS
jgi:hypothetical protein